MAKKSTASFWLEAIGVLVGAYSLFSLSQSAFEFGLSNLFDRLTDFYRAVFHPIAGVAEPHLNWLVSRFGLSLPTAWPDFAVFYFVIAGAVIRVHAGSDRHTPAIIRLATSILHGLFWLVLALIAPIAIALHKDTLAAAGRVFTHYRDVFLQIVYVFVALIIFLALNAYGP